MATRTVLGHVARTITRHCTFLLLRDKVACQTLDSTTPFLPSECTKPELELVVETYILNTDTSRHQNLYFNTMILANSGVRGSLSQQDQ
jgi:hypothetical protein